MRNFHTRAALVAFALTTWLPAKDNTKPADAEPVPASAAATLDPELEARKKEQEALAIDNKLEAERLTQSTNAMRAEVERLKIESELIAAKLGLESARQEASLRSDLAKLEAEKNKLAQEGELSKIRAEKLANDLKAAQTEAALDIIRLQSDIDRIETTEKRAKFADSKPVFLKDPLKENGILIVSDRRIPLNGPITASTADFVCDRIQYWNNKDRELPIFIVIDASPGGSVMAGYRILKSMESSDAPVHVVVKSFAASMAAAIATLATESYAYPNAVLLHHQISAVVAGQLNLTQQREFHQESERWWKRLGTPIAEKMGITPEEFITKMYLRSSSGDWSEFGEQAKELKWVNHIVSGIDETSFTTDPDAVEKPSSSQQSALVEQIDEAGKPFVWLPRLNPKDVYFIHSPDGYYRTR